MRHFFTYMHNSLRLCGDFYVVPKSSPILIKFQYFVHNYLIWMMLLLVNFLFGPLFVQNIYCLEVWVSGTRFGQNGYFFGWLEGRLKMSHNLNIFKARSLNIYFLIYSLWLFCWKTYIVLLLLIFLSGLYHWQWQVDTCILNVSVPIRSLKLQLHQCHFMRPLGHKIPHQITNQARLMSPQFTWFFL